MAANTLIKEKQQKDFADEIFRNETEAYIFCLNFLLIHLRKLAIGRAILPLKMTLVRKLICKHILREVTIGKFQCIFHFGRHTIFNGI